MKAQIYSLKISCLTNPDYNGFWYKEDVEDEIQDIISRKPTKNEWLEWVFDHMFREEPKWTTALSDMIAKNDMIQTIEVKLRNDFVKIEKCYTTKLGNDKNRKILYNLLKGARSE